MYRLGSEHGKVEVNPTAALKRKLLSNDRPRYLTEDESERLDHTFQNYPNIIRLTYLLKILA